MNPISELKKIFLELNPNLSDADLNMEVDYYVQEGNFLREMIHNENCCQYVNGKCTICGGFELESFHPNFR